MTLGSFLTKDDNIPLYCSALLCQKSSRSAAVRPASMPSASVDGWSAASEARGSPREELLGPALIRRHGDKPQDICQRNDSNRLPASRVVARSERLLRILFCFPPPCRAHPVSTM